MLRKGESCLDEAIQANSHSKVISPPRVHDRKILETYICYPFATLRMIKGYLSCVNAVHHWKIRERKSSYLFLKKIYLFIFYWVKYLFYPFHGAKISGSLIWLIKIYILQTAWPLFFAIFWVWDSKWIKSMYYFVLLIFKVLISQWSMYVGFKEKDFNLSSVQGEFCYHHEGWGCSHYWSKNIFPNYSMCSFRLGYFHSHWSRNTHFWCSGMLSSKPL